jgi:hypothetical protein
VWRSREEGFVDVGADPGDFVADPGDFYGSVAEDELVDLDPEFWRKSEEGRGGLIALGATIGQ